MGNASSNADSVRLVTNTAQVVDIVIYGPGFVSDPDHAALRYHSELLDWLAAELVAGGEDLMANLISISSSMMTGLAVPAVFMACMNFPGMAPM